MNEIDLKEILIKKDNIRTTTKVLRCFLEKIGINLKSDYPTHILREVSGQVSQTSTYLNNTIILIETGKLNNFF